MSIIMPFCVELPNMSINRSNFGKSIVAARALLGLNRMDLASRAELGHETIARAERGEDAVSSNVLSTIQEKLEQAGIEFPDGTLLPAVRLREFSDLSLCAVVADPSMPKQVRFQSPTTIFTDIDICSYLNIDRALFEQILKSCGAPSPFGVSGFQSTVLVNQRSSLEALELTPFPQPFLRNGGVPQWRFDDVKMWAMENQSKLASIGIQLPRNR
jgi:transcriptional regulator with XRE-family HTH domain